MNQIDGTDVILTHDDEKALTLLREIHYYAGPGWVRQPGEPSDPYGDVSNYLLDLELVTCGPEPMGTYGPDGREEYGHVWHLTDHGREELACWA